MREYNLNELKKEQKKEFNSINLIIKENENNKIMFDIEIFLKNVILLHLKYKQIDIKFLLKVAIFPKKKKTKLLLIDYI